MCVIIEHILNEKAAIIEFTIYTLNMDWISSSCLLNRATIEKLYV